MVFDHWDLFSCFALRSVSLAAAATAATTKSLVFVVVVVCGPFVERERDWAATLNKPLPLER